VPCSSYLDQILLCRPLHITNTFMTLHVPPSCVHGDIFIPALSELSFRRSRWVCECRSGNYAFLKSPGRAPCEGRTCHLHSTKNAYSFNHTRAQAMWPSILGLRPSRDEAGDVIALGRLDISSTQYQDIIYEVFDTSPAICHARPSR